MMNRVISMLMVLCMVFTLFPFPTCAFALTDAEKTVYEITNAFTYTVGEPQIRDQSDTIKQFFFYRDDIRIYGKLYLPDGEGPFPTVILSEGFRASCTNYSGWAREFAANGYAAVIFDFAGSYGRTQSGGELTSMSVLTEAADLNVVIDSLSTMAAIDTDNIFLWGHSFGGLVSTYVGCSRPEEIRGMILVEPSFTSRDVVMAMAPDLDQLPDVIYQPDYLGKIYLVDLYSFDIYDLMPDYPNDVLIFAATSPASIAVDYPEYYPRAAETFPSAEIVTVQGADHLFHGQPGEEMMELSMAFLDRHIRQS